MEIWLLTFSAILTFIIGLGIFFTNKLMYMKKKSDDEILNREKEDGHDNLDFFHSLPKKEMVIPSVHGYDIKGFYVPVHNTNHTIIICHGVTMNLLNSIKYMNLFLDLGWNVVLYDHRRHGQSGGKTTSYGYYEKDDLKSVVDWIKKEIGTNALIGIHGESMGAVTALLFASMAKDGADFYIADCPFATLDEQISYRLKEEFRLPSKLILPLANFFLKWRDGYRTRDVSPLAVIDNIKNPVLFIHSKDDDYIPLKATEKLFDKKTGPKKLYIAENGVHAMSYTKNRETYRETVKEFLGDTLQKQAKKSERTK